MRICSFLPSATEIICELGLEKNLVGITHECDYPPHIKGKSQVVFSSINHKELSSREIDKVVSKSRSEGKSTYYVDQEELLKADPDIIVTQGLCDVCAVSEKSVEDAISILKKKPKILSLNPHTLEDILETILIIGKATNTLEKAKKLVRELTERINYIKNITTSERDKPRVLCLEWLDPPYIAGHWIPQMVEYAGGIHGLVKPGKYSTRVSWDDIVNFAPQVVILMPCGYNIEQTLNEIDVLFSNPKWHQLPASKKGEVYMVDANSYFSRPSPRIVEGLEIIANILHPTLLKKRFSPENIQNLRNSMHLLSFIG